MRRRRKYTWFPNLGTDLDGTNEWSGRSFFIDVPDSGAQLCGVIPLVPDAPIEGGDVTQIQQSLEQEYVIERIVGKFHAEFLPETTPEGGTTGNQVWPAARLTVGLFVARANGDPAVGDANVPVGGGTTAGVTADYNPANLAQIREPWLWRRTWILSNAEATPNPTNSRLNAGLSYPSNTAGYGSVLDGPHVDSKVGRRIGNDDRLWLAFASQGYPIGNSLTNDPVAAVTSRILGEFDYRILGALRKPRNRSAF